MNRKALGKGIGALFNEMDREPKEMIEVPIASLKPSPYQTRRGFSEQRLEVACFGGCAESNPKSIKLV